jgi:anti-anti-sigma factor
MLRIDIQSYDGVATLRCSGRLVFGVETEMLRTMVQSRPDACVRVNLSEVEQIDASGLGLLVELQNWAEENRRGFTLVDLSEQVWRLVIFTKLCAVLDVSYSDETVISSRDRECAQRELVA